jgi:Fe-S cluster assembly protein SufD
MIESYVSLKEGAYFTNAVSEIVLEEGARVEHCKLQNESQKAYHIATIQVQQATTSNYISHSISAGAHILRNNICSVLDGKEAECVLNGLYVGHDEQLVDHHTVIDHAKPNCNSHEYYHGILGGHAKGIFNGKIFVRKDAQKTNAKQTNKGILLSDNATMDTKPQLEIFADDVKCTHGATIGQLDEDAIFYLQARGIGLALARRMLIFAFASDILNRITVEPVREQISQFITNRLEEDYAGMKE